MSLLTLPDAPRVTASRRPTAVRVSAGNGSQRVVPLAVGKTTIGSSPQCVVCLPSGEARPLQCLVTTTADQTEATRWGAGALLNGRDFTRSAILAGDRLSIGRFQLEFLADEAVDESAVEAPAAEAPVAEAKSPTLQAPTAKNGSEALPISPVASGDAELPVETAAREEFLQREETTPQAQPAVSPVAPAALTVAMPQPSVAAANDVAVAVTQPAVPARVEEKPFQVASSQSFADRLIVDLWQAAFGARSRATALIRGIRDARDHADAMAADLSAMECELDLARAAYDSSAQNHQELHMELLEHDRQATERMAPLQAEIDSLRSQLQESQTELAEQAAHCEELDAALAIAIAAQPVPATEAPPSVDADRVKELEQSLAVQIDQASWLARELGGLRSEIERARNELERESTRSRELEAELETAQAATATLEQSKFDLEQRDQTIASLQSELASRDAQVSDLSHQLAAAEEKLLQPVDNVWAPKTESAASIETPAEPLAAEVDLSPSPVWPVAPVESEPNWPTSLLVDRNDDAVQEPVKQPTPDAKQSFAAVEASPAPIAAPAAAAASFIDKYRHLLDDEGEAPSPEPPARMRLDEEFLSPAKAAQHVSPSDDSDDALEAYMAGMMQRVRGSSNAPAHLASQVELTAPIAAPTPRSASSAALASAEDEAIDDEPFDIESMKQGRRPAASTDLSAMREIANSSARSAIAKHRKRRTAESTFGKVVVATIALATASCLMWKATSPRDWEFIVGAGFGLIGFAMVAVIGRVAGRAASDKRADARANVDSLTEPTGEV